MWSQRHVADRVDRRTVILLPYRATALATATAHDGGGCGCIERAGATAGAASAVYRRNKREAILSRQRPSASDNCECQVARQRRGVTTLSYPQYHVSTSTQFPPYLPTGERASSSAVCNVLHQSSLPSWCRSRNSRAAFFSPLAVRIAV
jgi:hypothetical protein